MHRVQMSMLAGTAALIGAAGLGAQEPPEVTHEGLVRVEESAVGLAYVLPEADFSVYQRFMIIEPGVAFRKDWQRDFNRNRRGVSGRVTDADMERIKTGMAELFLEVFTADLEEAGYAIVEEPAEDVLILRPAIINLDVTSPDIQSADRTSSFAASAGSATLYIEFYDSVTGQILARVADAQRARDWGRFQWANSVSNRAEAREVLGRWADMLVNRLNEIHGD